MLLVLARFYYHMACPIISEPGCICDYRPAQWLLWDSWLFRSCVIVTA